MYHNAIQSYRRTNVVTADPKRLVLMCYEGAIDSLKIGKQKLIEKDYEVKGKALTKVQDIINELLHSLDFEKGGVIARNLDSLYNYMLRRIIHADVKKDIRAIDEVVGMLNELKSAWEEIFIIPEKEIKPEAVELDEERRPQASGYGSL
jgi:flagellar protein FliS